MFSKPDAQRADCVDVGDVEDSCVSRLEREKEPDGRKQLDVGGID